MRNPINHAERQRGAILVVSLLLLLVLSILAVTASQTTRMEERMAGNARDTELAFQAGEAGLRAAEAAIQEDLSPEGNLVYGCTGSVTCEKLAAREDTAALDFVDQDTEWWGENGAALGKDLADISLEPHYYSQVWVDVSDTLTKGASQAPGTMYYKSISRAQGATATAVTLIESTYAVRY
jgi:type IV pilus assembly protein PilX